MLPEHKNPIFVSKRPKISEKSPILTQISHFRARNARKRGLRRPKKHKKADFVLGGFPDGGFDSSFNNYGRPASLYDLFWSPVWALYSVLWPPNRYRRNPLPWLRVAEPLLPHRCHRGRGYSFRPLMASRSLVSISSASSGLSSRTLFTPSRPWASLLSL